VPLRVTVCGLVLLVALSLIDKDPERVPKADGMKVNKMVQVFCELVSAGSPLPQLFVWVNSVDEVVMLLIVSGICPMLVSTTGMVVLEANPTTWGLAN